MTNQVLTALPICEVGLIEETFTISASSRRTKISGVVTDVPTPTSEPESEPELRPASESESESDADEKKESDVCADEAGGESTPKFKTRLFVDEETDDDAAVNASSPRETVGDGTANSGEEGGDFGDDGGLPSIVANFIQSWAR